MKKLIIFSFLCFLACSTYAQILEERVAQILSQMSTEEKIYQLINNTFFTTGDNARLDIPGFQMSDGPHGVRFGGATSFPTGISMAAAWDTELNRKVGKAMGEEFWAYGKHQQLGPCLDLCRDPRNGRSPESGGEDPYLAGKMAAAVIKGIQETPVIATAKHFNLVNKQQYRHDSNITISERWLMEHYGLNFRIAIQEGGVLSVMNAYNLLNGVHCSESEYLLQVILRERWGFPFYVVSDWGAVYNSKNAIQAGTDICMGSDHYEKDLLNLLNAGIISEAILNEAVSNVLRTKLMAGMLGLYPKAPSGLINSDEHQQLALEAAKKAMILLKNQDKILPLDASSPPRIALIGPSANKAQLDGFGSSWVEAIYTVSPREGIAEVIGNGNIDYVSGCDINSNDTTRFAAARNAAERADFVVFIGGLDDTQEGEGFGDRPEYDRTGGSIQLPGKQQDLINALAQVNENIIVIIQSGGICGIERCIENIKGLIYAFYPGQEGGNAIADVLFGRYNPGGKLPVTMPKGDYQLPAWNDNFNDDFGCGYRWFDQFQIEPEYVFGHGLSYTDFTYRNLQVSSPAFENGQPIQVSFDIMNTGNIVGEEVAQLYITDETSSIWMPKKQLKSFERIEIQPGSSKTVRFDLTAEDFYFWNEATDAYMIEPGTFTIKVGGSSGNLPLQQSVEISSEIEKPDLVVSEIFTYPRFPVEGDTIYLFAYVQNIGGDEFKSGTQLTIDFHNGQEFVASASHDDISIPAGGMKMVEINIGNWITDQDGLFEITASIDDGDVIEETIETNNYYIKSIQVFDSLTLILNHNLALNKPASASSQEGIDLGPEFAVDGNLGTRWSSQFYDPQEFIVDLENLYDIVQIRIQWETAYSSSFKIDVSQNSFDWTEVITQVNGDGNIDEFNLETTARYIRFTGLKRATEWGHSFYEFEVYGVPHESVVSVKESAHSILKHVQIFPNPVKNKLFISNIQSIKPIDLKMYNSKGQLIMSKQIFTDQSIDVRKMNPGVYYVHMELGDLQRTVRLIKK